MLTSRYKPFFNRLFEPPARLLVACRVPPSVVTLAGVGLVGAACARLLVTRRILEFCALVALASLFDALDGAVARRGGRVTRWGAYLDAMCDRYAETLIVLTVAAVTGYWLLSGLLLSGALLVSYAKARAAMEAPVSNLEWPDLMERAERGALYLLGLVGGQLVVWRPWGRDLFWWTLALLAVLTHATVLQRMRRAKGFIEGRSRAG